MDLKIKTEKEEFHGRTCGIIKQENNSCVIEQANSFNLVGENVMLIAKDKKTNETIDMLVITIRGV